jgi:hypothetical protein
MYDSFGCLTDKQLSAIEVREKAHKLVETYPSDLEDSFVHELTMFLSLCASNSGVDSVTKMLQMQTSKNVNQRFS